MAITTDKPWVGQPPGIWVDNDKKVIVVRPPKHPAEEIKDILGGSWDKKDRVWRVQPTALNVIVLGEWYGPGFIGTAPQAVQDLFKEEWGFKGFDAPANGELRDRAYAHPRWNDLYPFQKTAVEYVVCNPHRGTLLSLSPGLGKTVVTIIAMDVLEAWKVLVLAPLTLAKNWGKEIVAWSRFNREWSRATAADKNPQTALVVTNFETVFYTVLRNEDGKIFEPEDDLTGHVYDNKNKKITKEELAYGQAGNPRAAKKWIEEGPTKKNPKTGKKMFVRERITQARPTYAEIDWDLIVVDESILLKNRKAVKVDVIQQLAKYSHYVLMLSGSPTAKFRDDLFPQLKTIMPRGFSSYWRFAEFFCVIDRGEWGWNITADRPNVDPQRYLKDLLLVMNQKDVLPDLPDYIYNPIEIDLLPEQQKAFQQMVDDWIVQLEDEDEDPDLAAVNRLAQQTRLLQITSNLVNLEKGAGKKMPNASAKEELLVDLIKQGDIEFPLLVWSWYVPTTQSIDTRIEKEFKDEIITTYVTGAMTGEQKDNGIESYKNGEVDVLVLQMGVGKFGHTLTNTRTVYYHDRSLDSDAYLQSLFRVRRIGLTHVPRLIIPRAQFSADPIVELNLAGKMQSIAKIANHDLQSLLKSLGGLEWSMFDYNTGLDTNV